MTRLLKAISEKMRLLHVTQKADEWEFRVRGTTSTYDQRLSADSYSCSCPDHTDKKTFCKHLLFLVVRAAKQ